MGVSVLEIGPIRQDALDRKSPRQSHALAHNPEHDHFPPQRPDRLHRTCAGGRRDYRARPAGCRTCWCATRVTNRPNDCRGSSEHDEAARHHQAATGPSGTETRRITRTTTRSTANPFPKLPDPLTLKNGKKVTSADMWNKQRRPEIVEDFEREVLGRVPKNVPKVTWTVTETAHGMVGDRPTLGKQLVGHVDNSSYPGDHRRHSDDDRHAGRRQGAGAGDDDVRRRTRHSRRRAAGRRSRPAGPLRRRARAGAPGAGAPRRRRSAGAPAAPPAPPIRRRRSS